MVPGARASGEPSQEKPFGLLVSTGLGARQRLGALLVCGPRNLSLKLHPSPRAAACLFLSFLFTACSS